MTQHQQRLGETCIFISPTIVIFQSRLVAHNERNSDIPVILIHVNDRNVPVKKEKLSDWDNHKKNVNSMLLQEIHVKHRNLKKGEIKRWKKHK